MFELVVLVSQTLSLGLITGWLFTGVRDNILYPTQNELYTSQVLTMERIRDDYPEAFLPVAHRAIADRKTQKTLFRLVVIVEVAVLIVMMLGVGALTLAVFSVTTPQTARALGLLGALGFTLIWGGFLVVGNHFSYWFGHEGAQNTHYQMTLWGMANMIFLAIV